MATAVAAALCPAVVTLPELRDTSMVAKLRIDVLYPAVFSNVNLCATKICDVERLHVASVHTSGV